MLVSAMLDDPAPAPTSRSYAALEVDFGPGPQLVWGPNAAGKTSLLEAMVVLARGGSHRTTTDAELIRWGADVARIEGRAGSRRDRGRARPAGLRGGRRRARGSGSGSTAWPRRAAALAERLRVVLFAPEDMLLVAGSPSLRRATLDQLAATLCPGYAAELATYGRALQQRNGLLRAIREETAARDELRYWDRPFLDAGGAVVAAPPRAPRARSPQPLAAAHAEIAPEEAAAGALGLEYVTNAPAVPGRGAARRAGAAARGDGREGGLERHDARSGRTATTWRSRWPAATSPASPRAASSGRRSSPSSSPSSTS